MPKYTFSELVDIPQLQALMDAFHEVVGMTSGIIDPDGSIVIANGWLDICTKFHRADPRTEARCIESDTYINSRLLDLDEGEHVSYTCKNGLSDVAVPVIIDGEHITTIFGGQFFYEGERPDREFFLRQAEEFGFDVDKYMAALDEVPSFSKEQVRKILKYFTLLAKMVTDMGIARLKQKEVERSLEESLFAQQQVLRELSTPVIPVMNGIIVVPLVAGIDSMRARDITRALLAGVSAHRAKVVILDITGVPVVDSGVADHLNKTIMAVRLKGARTIITGISDAVAETMVDLGIDWQGVETLSDLQTGLVSALDAVGMSVQQQR